MGGCCFEGRNATFCAFWWGPRRSCSAWWRIKEVGGWDTFCEGWGACALRAGLPLPLPFPSFHETYAFNASPHLDFVSLLPPRSLCCTWAAAACM